MITPMPGLGTRLVAVRHWGHNEKPGIFPTVFQPTTENLRENLRFFNIKNFNIFRVKFLKFSNPFLKLKKLKIYSMQNLREKFTILKA